MFCKHCGRELPDYAKFCDKCGTCITDNIQGVKQHIDVSILDKLALIGSYITSPAILILRFLLEENTRLTFGRGIIGYKMMLSPAMMIVVGMIAVGLIIFSNSRFKNFSDKNKKILKVMNVVNVIASAAIILFSY